ncbi:MAG: hypothetical protein A2381_08905 [Bdellovibrionales bacterium RIFOXYB1_FULL_37_110]|nr:MAG: hypothetical protein A2181_09100 [Bdellovibrionales bacterium RIFOXYA1_FULL_38_20]OFZ50347.1 MAG: hypothetical protein A2417_09005 [Bdellovibrionales bacterium RIFOXYC1_FULL_37_79]OFZ60956.1 MAG: hypothetical protein A2381_08905 [Bdellovibrionales bacterium RIFOXYB1_FULL_37_110]OFZ63700.1 MAG: hypothetical protein A2577_08025 [Bdellovibrionales bacterium RIFOXYD1_FULL_36_51]
MFFVNVILLFFASYLFLFNKSVLSNFSGFFLYILLIVINWINMGYQIISIILLISSIMWVIVLLMLYFSTYKKALPTKLIIGQPWFIFPFWLSPLLLSVLVVLILARNSSSELGDNMLPLDYQAFITLDKRYITFFVLFFLFIIGISIVIGLINRHVKGKIE